MKKTFLLICGVAAGLTAAAQSAQPSAVFEGKLNLRTAPYYHGNLVSSEHQSPAQRDKALNKGTSATERWYSFYDEVESYEGVNFGNNSFVYPMWFDSTMVVNYTSGPGPLNYSSTYQYIDPINNKGFFNDPAKYNGEVRVGSTNSYKVDSVYIQGGYIANVNRPGGVVDTLIISVAPAAPGVRSYLRSNPNGNFAQYLPAGKDTLKVFSQYYVDSTGRGVYNDVGTYTDRVYMKVPLTLADRDTESANGFPIKYWVYALPNGGITIPAGRGFGFSFTFKSGDTWTPNVDTVGSRHIFYFTAGYVNANQAMPYYYYSTFAERSMPGLMFSTLNTLYPGTIVIEALNSNDVAEEFLNMGAHITCPTCPVVSGIKEVTSFNTVSSPFPNPATSEINIRFNTKASADVRVSVTNTMGQVVKSANVGHFNTSETGIATVSTDGLTNGIYFISLEANGFKTTKRFVVLN